MLSGAMGQLRVGDPAFLSTDVGPVIDEGAAVRLQKHILRLSGSAVCRKISETPVTVKLLGWHFIAPQIWEVPEISWLTDEVFGPILHVVRYAQRDLEKVIAAINATGFGLTGGVHTRIETTMRTVERNLHVGNFYVNRSLIGAIVGSQPFGGEGLSGTGPKAGGPHYLARFAAERVTSTNITAAGGNASLIMMASGEQNG
jgi:RHH-type proline utilization regulon transcriptional repressor/proline dehydrogenase/delta 1-pyrroline-5-carboxylate dehydrogenase